MICYLEIFYYVSSKWRLIENWKRVIFKVARNNITLWKDLRRKFLSLPSIYYFIRSEIFFKIVVLKNFAIFTGKHSYWSFFFYKIAGHQACSFVKKRLQHRCFPVNIATFFRTTSFTEHLQFLLLPILVICFYRQELFPSLFFGLKNQQS